MYGVKRASGNGRTTLSRRAPFRGLGDDLSSQNDLSSLPLSALPIANEPGAVPTASSLTLNAASSLNLTTLAYWGLAAALGVLVLGVFSGGRR